MSKHYVKATATATVQIPSERSDDDIISFSCKITRKARNQFSDYCRAIGISQNEAVEQMFSTHAVVTKDYYQEQINKLKELRDNC